MGTTSDSIRAKPARAALTALVAGLVAAAVIVGVPAGLGSVLEPYGPITTEAGITILLFGSLIAAGLVGLRVQRLAPTWSGSAPAPALAIGLAIGGGGLALAAALATLAGLVMGGAPGGSVGAALLLGLAVVVVQVLGEEVFVRGWLLPSLARDLGMGGAVIATALLFAVLHLLGGVRSPLTLINLALGGVLFGLLAWRSGGLLAPIAAHFAWNVSEMLLLGLDPNPGVSVYGAIWNFDLVGQAMWGGSAEGLNASVAATVVLVALILPVAAWRSGVESVTAKAPTVPAPAAPTPNRHAWLLGEES